MPIHTIQFGDEGQLATRELLRRFDAAAAGEPGRHAPLRQRLATLEALDRQYGGTSPLELEDVDQLVAAILRDLAALDDSGLAIEVALWAIR